MLLSTSELLGLKTLEVPYTIGYAIEPMVAGSILKAARIVVDELREEILLGLPVAQISVERLDDYDAGQWSELVFLITVDLSRQEANERWDKLIDRLADLAESQTDESLRTALSEDISVQFRWY